MEVCLIYLGNPDEEVVKYTVTSREQCKDEVDRSVYDMVCMLLCDVKAGGVLGCLVTSASKAWL